MEKFTFIDLFAGLGGFHVALEKMGGKCVFASELDETLRTVYEKNFSLKPTGDIRLVSPQTVPEHDVLCAGFPCQPFSKAGEQRGFECSRQGDLFAYVVDILRTRKPRCFILENVPNILWHDGGRTYEHIKERLEELGYEVREARLSPHQFGIPQVRERAYIVGSTNSLADFEWPEATKCQTSIESKLDVDPADAKPLSDQVVRCLDVWNRFLKAAPKKVVIPYFPLWSMEWGATYPFEGITPFAVGTRALTKFQGSHGVALRDLSPADRLEGLPSYARTPEMRFPKWKEKFIRDNRTFYAANRKWIDRWLPAIVDFPPSLQKLEWNVKGGERDIWKYVIQFRASGVRVKRLTHSPSLIAMTTTQVPIIAAQRRYMTPRECARLQSLDTLSCLPPSTAAFKALGNAVNSEVAKTVAQALLSASFGTNRKPISHAVTANKTVEMRT